MAVHRATDSAPWRVGAANADRLVRGVGGDEGGENRGMSAKKKKFSITLTDADEQRVRLAAALEGRGFSSMGGFAGARIAEAARREGDASGW